MFDIGGPLGGLLNFLVIAIGFGAIIFIHELGHFVAAKWAGIRVLAFSMGFGQVLVSYRKGVGWRRGSSDEAYRKFLAAEASGAQPADGSGSDRPSVSPTEYRISMLPLGGYVKMLGQEDLNPDAVSAAPDSYQNCSIPKRMVVISAGVIMNLISAAALFIIVFMAGLPILPPVAGQVPAGSPAALAVSQTDGVDNGIEQGDTILEINGKRVRAFRDIATESAMSRADGVADVLVQRDGVDGPIRFRAELKPGGVAGLLDLGVLPLRSTTLLTTDMLELWEQRAALAGLSGVEPGSTIVAPDGSEIGDALSLQTLASKGTPFEIGVRDPSGELRVETVTPEPVLMRETYEIDDAVGSFEHAAGLTGVIRVDPDAPDELARQGLDPGDVFVRIADVAYPSLVEGIATIRAHKGGSITIVVRRGSPDNPIDVELEVDVSSDGRVGFLPSTTTRSSNLLGGGLAQAPEWATPGSRLVSINGEPIATLDQVPGVVRTASESGDPIECVLLEPDGTERTVEWAMDADQRAKLAGLGARWPGGDAVLSLLLPEQIIDKSPDPVSAIGRGLHESRRIMLQTYLTFLRLFQGTVKVEHLKGPVGIAHIGTMIADEGFIKVLFFLGLISINLAVINFLPLPIVDGGQFLMLCYEWIRGRPVPIVVQNAFTLAGLALIGTMFILVTFNDIRSLLGV